MHIDEYATINKCNIFEKEKKNTVYIKRPYYVVICDSLSQTKQNKTYVLGSLYPLNFYPST